MLGALDAWDDPVLRRAIQATGRRRLVIGGLYSEICVAYPTVHRAGQRVNPLGKKGNQWDH